MSLFQSAFRVLQTNKVGQATAVAQTLAAFGARCARHLILWYGPGAFLCFPRLIPSPHYARYYAISDHFVRQDSADSPVTRFTRSTLPFTPILVLSSIICSNSSNNSSRLANQGLWLPCCHRSRLIRSSPATDSRIGFLDRLPCLPTRKLSRRLLPI